MIQPIIENAIEHGKIYTLENGMVAIDFSKKGNMINVTINDNGIGLNSTADDYPLKKTSLALNIIKERIQFLKNKYNKMVSFDIRGDKGVGTQVSFAFPELTN
jgi:sensor histidine kinase YesM